MSHSINDAIWDNTNPCDVSLNNTNGTETLANTNVTKESITTTTTSMFTPYHEIWYNTHEECDSWHDVLETLDDYQEWNYPPTILEDTSHNNESPKEHIEPDFNIGDCQT